MSIQEDNDIDYEDMDDLQLFDHVEWNEIGDHQINTDDMEMDSDESYDSEHSLDFD